MASFGKTFQLNDMLEAPGSDGIGKLRNGLANQSAVFNFNITAFRSAIAQHQVNAGMRIDFDFPLDMAIF